MVQIRGAREKPRATQQMGHSQRAPSGSCTSGAATRAAPSVNLADTFDV